MKDKATNPNSGEGGRQTQSSATPRPLIGAKTVGLWRSAGIEYDDRGLAAGGSVAVDGVSYSTALHHHLLPGYRVIAQFLMTPAADPRPPRCLALR
ncbi:hypothetical protein E2C01_000257 [Portunus trituberculatus]|uniref:Uncharacterized protein n=1 Tax=Portunus trituberculatus TaxID=210409 RepID=A0A5B7CDL6_PORTR|nr:hypothetical protein [Portunus trituberculatus]